MKEEIIEMARLSHDEFDLAVETDSFPVKFEILDSLSSRCREMRKFLQRYDRGSLNYRFIIAHIDVVSERWMVLNLKVTEQYTNIDRSIEIE